jgi:hypothetical protein
MIWLNDFFKFNIFFKVHEMETFLADYGMVWVGDQEDPEADIYIEDNSTDKVRKTRQATGGLQLTDVTETKGQPDFRIDFSRLCENIRDLNIIAGEGKIFVCVCVCGVGGCFKHTGNQYVCL